MRLNTVKAVSKTLAALIFLFLFLLKETFPKPAYAFTSLNSCARSRACLELIKESTSPAVKRSFINPVVDFVIVTGPSAAYVAWHLWHEAQTKRAQERAKERYCAVYPTDVVCPGQLPGVHYRIIGDISYAYPTRVISGKYWITVFNPQIIHFDSINNSGPYQPYGSINSISLNSTLKAEYGNNWGPSYDPVPASYYTWQLVVSWGNPTKVQVWRSGGG